MTDELERSIRDACDRADWEAALTAALRGYGAELLGYLNALLREPVEADDVFASVCEDLWSGISRFTWASSFRTWAYAITRNACMSFVRSAHKRRAVALSSTALAAVAQEVRTKTASYLASRTRDKLAEIRASLEPDDQTLLILRIDRGLAWREIAEVFEPQDTPPDAIDRRAAALRKRFERLKAELRERLAGP